MFILRKPFADLVYPHLMIWVLVLQLAAKVVKTLSHKNNFGRKPEFSTFSPPPPLNVVWQEPCPKFYLVFFVIVVVIFFFYFFFFNNYDMPVGS